MNIIRLMWMYLILGISIVACTPSDQEALDNILASEEIYIQQNTYGGLAGYSEDIYHFKKTTYHEYLLIMNEGTDYQTFVRIDYKEVLTNFILSAYESHSPEKAMSNSCVTGIDHEYVFKSGRNKITVRPSLKSDSLFFAILK